MRKRLSRVLKNRIFIFILGGLILGSAGVLAATYFPSSDVTYDNSSSGLSSTNVQGAIDELYNEFSSASGFTVNMLGKKVELSLSCDVSGRCSDGLYQDPEDEKRFTFRGENPNNYITFNNEKAGWRIISIEPDGTIKIMKNNSIGNMQWHNVCQSNYYPCHNWTSSSLNNYLNNTYYNGLSETSKNQIVSKGWTVLETSDPFYGNNSVTWNGKIALVENSDLRKSTPELIECATISIEYFICGDTWMNNNTAWWLLSVPAGGSNSSNNSAVYRFEHSGSYYVYRTSATDSYGVRPVLYISSDVKITGGNGTSSNPYTLG